MKILVLGAGAIGGYFGGRLLQSGQDVTFLVRPARRAELKQRGLVITSPRGNLTINDPPAILAEDARGSADLVIFACKAYDLESAIDSIHHAVGTSTAILPLLNGIKHLGGLSEAFGRDRVLGGQCVIATQLDAQHTIAQMGEAQTLSFGELTGTHSERAAAIASALRVPNVEGRLSDTILLDMWEKWVMLATMAGISCLMRATLGDVLTAPGGHEWISSPFEENCQIATSEGFSPRKEFVTRTLGTLLQPGSPLSASMFRDIEAGHRIEADHILGDLLARKSRRNDPGVFSLLELAYGHVKVYEARRERAIRH